ncbi:MAG: ABC transporter ATP-binding protein [Pseudomonadota bacterium]
MEQGRSIVHFVNVAKTYDGERLIVDDLSLEIIRGEFLTLLGPSGSGKTTTLMMLAGFETPTRGQILLNGREINRLAPHRRGIGMVFQNYALFPHMTVAENLAFPLTVRSLAKAEVEARVLRALDLVKLGGFAARRPAQLSGGQQQRIAVARALIFEPELVLMDEPLGALDKQLREGMQYEIRELHERLGVTIVYVTHDQAEALTMSDRIAVFDQGKIQQLASPIELYERPRTSFVANFVGDNNLMAACVDTLGEGRLCSVVLEGGDKVNAMAAGELMPGQKVMLSLRPERLRLDADASAGTSSCLEGVVEEIVYLGDHMRILVRTANQVRLLIKAANKETHHGLAKGSMLTFGWSAQDCRALPV